jgi:hypothetical protein
MLVRQKNHKHCALVPRYSFPFSRTRINMPRKKQLTHNKILEITKNIKADNYAITACRLAGVSERTYYYWLALGKQQESSIYAEFHEAVEQAEAEREARLVEKLAKLDTRIPLYEKQLQRKQK